MTGEVASATVRGATGPIAVLVALALAGCGGSDDRDPAPTATRGTPAERVGGARKEPSDLDRLRTLLRERADALETGDARAYARTATGIQIARDRRAARRAARLRLRDVELEATKVDVAGRRAAIRARASYGVEGVSATFNSARRMSARRVGGAWRIWAVRGERGLPPWEVGPFEERRTRHFVVLAPPEVPVNLLERELEAGYKRMRELLPRGRLRRRYLVVVAGDVSQARALTSAIRGVENLTAISDATVRERGRQREVTEVVSLRLFVLWPRFAALDPERRRRVVTHELTHAALAGSTSGRTPAWLVEGVALYVSGDRRLAPPGADLGDLAGPYAIARLRADAQADAYAASSAAAFAIAERFGRRRLLALYDAFNDHELNGKPGRRLVNRALRRELGISPADVLS